MRTIILATAVALAATPAIGQVNTGSGNGLVAVNVQDVSVLNNFLNQDQITALSNLGVPITVNVPVGVAATVCGVTANVLAHQKKGGTTTCDAKSGSNALAQSVVAQKLTQKK